MSGLIKDLYDTFTLKSDCHRIGIRVDEVYVNLERIDGKLIISTHPLGTGIIDNYIGKIETPLSGEGLVIKNIIDNYPTLKKEEK